MIVRESVVRKTYRVNPNGVPLFKGGRIQYRPGSEIEMEEHEAIELGDCLELDADGKPVIVTEAKALDGPAVDKMIRRSRAVRK